MPVQPTLQQLFGAGATETATTITIVKADLVPTGNPLPFNYDPASLTNTAEKNALALIHKWRANQDTSPDSQFAFSNWVKSLIQINSVWYMRYRTTLDVTILDKNLDLPNPNDV